VQGVSIDFVVIISYKHSPVSMPVVPQHPCDGGREVGELKAGVRCLDRTHTHRHTQTHTHTQTHRHTHTHTHTDKSSNPNLSL